MNPESRRGNRITKVYTRGGDAGETGLVGGRRVPKDDARIACFGTVDELNAQLGVAAVALAEEAGRFPAAAARFLQEHLAYIQNQLFTVGGDLATPLESRHPMMPVTTGEMVAYLERLCDACNEELEPLKDFILPGGTRCAATLQLARTVCRRAERDLVRLAREAELGPEVGRYLNRLSDALFVLARWANARAGVAEPIWRRDLREPPMLGERA